MKQFLDVASKYGAPMGRREHGTPDTPAQLFRVRLVDGAYDDGGAYWGGSMPLYCLRTADSEHFVRAKSRQEAYENFKESWPDLKLQHGIEVEKNDNRYHGNPIRTWRYDGVKVELFWGDGNYVAYNMFDRGELIFSGRDFRPGAATAPDSLGAVYVLMAFLTMQPGDTDDDHFAGYTDRQLDWASSFRAESLNCAIQNLEERYHKRRKQ